MVYSRLLMYFYAMLLVFSQQQVLIHPYQHKADWQQEVYQHLDVGHSIASQGAQKSSDESSLASLIAQDSYDSKQAPGHGANCATCLALSGISSVASSHYFVFRYLPNHNQYNIVAAQTFASAIDVPYQSRAPPPFA